ncbi:restriction endonuclease subunit S [Pseudoalteromonas ardens]|uniref:Type I restriction modification DNA specificity domain-containing protein n=1 Tax=Pseudoalteromonas rubra TaxID=43658 RepID=A0A0L0EQU9_9GAMM|nr:restriction endonuclease subunit S [Pseudoalteromonas sp. R96]KNC66750.1 hypothetical protein AC626_15010 [Pseudoalteromonas rubra]MDK1313940.1 restriction endonuclease subunit S [Pseudoalteromonas sp. R96]
MFEIIVDIPNYAGWNRKSIDQLCSIARRGTAPVYVENSSIKAIGQRCVTHGDFEPIFARPHSEKATSNILEAEKNDVLLNSTGTGTIGRSVIFDDPGKYIVDGHVTVLRPHKELVDSRWLNAVIRSKWFQSHLERFCYTGSTNQLELSRTYLNSSSLPIPPEEEQSQIGDVLDAIDTQIRETEAIIAKLQQVKQGLLHDLLTRGVDENGELRPSYEDAPELYKSSELGWIPVNWTCMNIGEAITKKYIMEVQDGNHGEIHPKTSDFVKDGVPFIMANDIQNNKINFDKCYRITEKQYESLRIGFSTASDVLLSHKGTVGQVAIVPDDCEKIMLTPQVTYYRCDAEQLAPQYLSCWFLGSYFQKILSALSAQSTRAYIGILAQRELPLLFPPKREQLMISERYSSIYNRYDFELTYLKKLKLKKSGLMDDLLTGKVRVTELLKQKQAS